MSQTATPGAETCGKRTNGKLHWRDVRRYLRRGVERLTSSARSTVATARGEDDGAKLHWADVARTGASVWQTPGVRVAALACALCLVFGTGVVGGFSGLATLCVLAAVWGTLVQCPALSTVHVFVDNSNVAIPLLSRGRRVNYATLREHLLRDPQPPRVWQMVAQALSASGYTAQADTLLTRQRGTLYVCGSGRAGRREAVWCSQARDAEFQVTLLTRVDRAVGYCGEESVDDDLHKHMANATMDAAGRGTLVSFLAVLGRTLGVVPRAVMVQVSGDGNANGTRGGFPAQLRRALQHGMNVEVAAWRECMSAQYPALAAEHSKWSTTHLRLRYLNDAEDVITDAAPTCRYGVGCDSARCTYAHPAPVEGSNTSPAEATPADATAGNAESRTTPASPVVLRSDDASPAETHPALVHAAPGSGRSVGTASPSPAPVAARICAGPPDDGTTWGRGARRARTSSTSSTASSNSDHQRASPATTCRVARAPPGLRMSRTADSTPAGRDCDSRSPRPRGRWGRLAAAAPGSLARSSHSAECAPDGRGFTTGAAVDDLTRFQSPCRYGARCTLRKCGFTHPAGWVRPPLLPTDRVVRARDTDSRPWAAGERSASGTGATASGRHSRDTRDRCSRDSTSSGGLAIPNFRRSTSAGHGRRRGTAFRGVDCRYGTRCTAAHCGFSHPPEWVRPDYTDSASYGGGSASPRCDAASPPRAAHWYRSSGDCRSGASSMAQPYSFGGFGPGHRAGLTFGSRSPSVH